ncbi:MAG: hypothetical protein ACRDJM_11260, partial [Actinomycetota bacterium]
MGRRVGLVLALLLMAPVGAEASGPARPATAQPAVDVERPDPLRRAMRAGAGPAAASPPGAMLGRPAGAPDGLEPRSGFRNPAPVAAPVAAPVSGRREAEPTAVWESRVSSEVAAWEFTTGLALSPDGARAFVASQSTGRDRSFDAVVAAHDLATGSVLWRERYDGAGGFDTASGVATSPDGARVYLGGYT